VIQQKTFAAEFINPLKLIFSVLLLVMESIIPKRKLKLNQRSVPL